MDNPMDAGQFLSFVDLSEVIGKKKVKFHISLCILVVQVVALARIQNGITEQTGRHAFLT
ncbi:MAG: hypothetical protein QXT63_06915 [Thermoplasmata archaeon]